MRRCCGATLPGFRAAADRNSSRDSLGVAVTGYSNKTFACPFFKWDEKLAVHCEGGRVTFPDKEAALEYIDRYCGSPAGWRSCSVAASLLKYYERKD